MTVLVGVLCSDGVVIGADSLATFGSLSNKTIEQPTRKLSVIGGQIIVATSGQIGLGQRFVRVVDILNQNKKLKGDSIEHAIQISTGLVDDYRKTSVQQVDIGGLVAFVNKNKPCLFEFAYGTIQPEQKDDRIWYVSMGSGQNIADPFLALMRKCYCDEGPPDLATGKFITAWTLAHVCETNPGGVKDPFHLAVLEKHPGHGWSAKELSVDDIAEHNGMIEDAYNHLAKFSADAEDVPEIPD